MGAGFPSSMTNEISLMDEESETHSNAFMVRERFVQITLCNLGSGSRDELIFSFPIINHKVNLSLISVFLQYPSQKFLSTFI